MAYGLAGGPHQVLAPEGQVVGTVPDLPAEQLVQMYRWMVLGRSFSERMIALQRQGRMGTFPDHSGQEAAQVGLAMPLRQQDWLVATYRDLITYMVKGVPPLALMEVYRGYVGDGYPRSANALPFQVVIGDQMLHAAGVAMAARIQGDDVVVAGLCGDGATSQGDFAEALNFAGTYRAPAVFFVQNNGWAISVPRERQTAAEYIAHRGPGYGMPGVVVDGNDVLAVYAVVQEAVARAQSGEGPTLIEALTYRLGAHTTADDPKRYRPAEELAAWAERDPLIRYGRFLQDRGLLSPADADGMRAAAAAEVAACVAEMEALPPEDPLRIFDLVYGEPTPQLRRQQAALRQELEGE